MKYLRYYSEFNDNIGHSYRIEILEEADSAFSPQEITLSADNPVTIEWHTIEKTDNIMSSACTLNLNSDSDRQFIDLYKIEIGAVRLDVYRDGELYWSGTLDTELYEEPYSYQKNYDVQITFSDFAILERKEFALTGIISVEGIINYCLNKTDINYTELVKFLSTRSSNVSSANLLSNDRIASSNFYDEEGEPMKLLEVLEGILKPYDLHIKQKGGKIYIWDWHSMYSNVPSEQIAWDGDDAVLGVDKVYNKVIVNFSPYQIKEVLAPKVKGYVADVQSKTVLVETIPLNYQPLAGFKIDYGTTGRGLSIAHPSAKFYRIEAINSGEDSCGVAWRIVIGGYNGYGTKVWDYFLNNAAVNSADVSSNKELFSVTTTPFFATRGSGKTYMLKLSLDLMFDPRINPFEQADDNNEKGNYEGLQDRGNFAYVPIILNYRATNGIVYHWSNRSVAFGGKYGMGAWAEGEGQWGNAYLAYYDESERKDKSGLTGFVTNKRCIGAYLGELPKTFTTNNEGEWIAAPPYALGGTLELKVGTGVMIWENITNNPREGVYRDCKWVLYKDPKIEVIDKYGKSPDAEDIEIKAWLNKEAKEELSIDTIVGTTVGEMLCARGIIFRVGVDALTNYSRGGHTGTLEQLLIGTLYSQYATRHTKLSGTTLIPSTFATYTDRATNEKFALMGEMENLIDGSAEVELCELSPDEYDAIEYDDND